MSGPCMCGDPECSKCYPNWRENRWHNSAAREQEIQREVTHILGDGKLLEEALIEHMTSDGMTVARIIGNKYRTGDLPRDLQHIIDDAVAEYAEACVDNRHAGFVR